MMNRDPTPKAKNDPLSCIASNVRYELLSHLPHALQPEGPPWHVADRLSNNATFVWETVPNEMNVVGVHDVIVGTC